MQSDKPLVHVIDDDQAVRELLRGGGSARPSTSFLARENKTWMPAPRAGMTEKARA
jgi:hypothetical protein